MSVINILKTNWTEIVESVQDHVKKHLVIYGAIAILLFAILLLTGTVGSFAMLGAYAAIPHFMFLG